MYLTQEIVVRVRQKMENERKQTIFGFANYLTQISKEKPEGVDCESLDVAIQCLQQAFNFSLENTADKEKYKLPLPFEQIFRFKR